MRAVPFPREKRQTFSSRVESYLFSAHSRSRRAQPTANSPSAPPFSDEDGFTQRSRAARQSGGCIGYASQGVKVAKDLLNSNELFMNRESCGSGECPRLSDVSLTAVPQIMLPATSREALRRHSRWGSCALVGNSGSLLKRRDGQRIDTHDIVVRFNEAPTVGVEAHVGNKTTHRMLNHIWAQGYADSKSAPPGFRLRLGYHPLEPNVTLLLNACIPARFCSLPRHFVQLQATMAFRRPDVQVLYSSKRVVGAANRLLAIYGACIYAGKRQSAPAPTTGLAAMLLLLKLCRAVTLFGMGGAEEAEYHYYDMGHGTVIKAASGRTTSTSSASSCGTWPGAASSASVAQAAAARDTRTLAARLFAIMYSGILWTGFFGIGRVIGGSTASRHDRVPAMSSAGRLASCRLSGVPPRAHTCTRPLRVPVYISLRSSS
eukprot:CAMPEP_0177755238 /NCGR_PEP_ID=MMETSP0491_2-20121128/2456_1 /TAXON_ID=63592 /ORGANISM="Tetraselmis chuii, Strain PLY429" /LENGTH=431 /DNA_ID=CAMNT_0019270715 /DNA_START=407 /DNA_END=1704 /DNA_ORIENTATION=-